jgi:ActR/RegA family two-component response regulator
VNNNKEDMAIKDKEVEYICSKADCPNIMVISLINRERHLNTITHEGMLHISGMRWDSLTSLQLSENYLIQPATTSAIKDANTSPKHTCQIWERSA